MLTDFSLEEQMFFILDPALGKGMFISGSVLKRLIMPKILYFKYFFFTIRL